MGYKVNKQFLGGNFIFPYISEIFEISNIPINNTNVYSNVTKNGYTIQEVKISFTLIYNNNSQVWTNISSNNSNTNRFGLEISYADGIQIRGRLNGNSDTYFFQTKNGFNSSGNNLIDFTIKRDGDCIITCNGTTTKYTSTSSALNIIQTIMNFSNMNVYGAQSGSMISGNKENITVKYV